MLRGISAGLLSATVWVTTAQALDELNWIAPSASRVAVLMERPAECFEPPSDPDAAYFARLGRAAFRSPVLLGGLAARSGMTCDSCHRNGHDNPTFFIAGVSSAPGTVDVTTAIFSKVRGDAKLNPVPIPTLVGAGERAPLGTVTPIDDLHGFVRSVVVEEFQGRAPASVLAGLVAYVAALDAGACPVQPTEVASLNTDLSEARAVYTILLESLDRKSPEATEFVLLSLQAALGRIAQRFPTVAQAQQNLGELSQSLVAIRPPLSTEPETVERSLTAWRVRLDATEALLAHELDKSLYDRDMLARWLANR